MNSSTAIIVAPITAAGTKTSAGPAARGGDDSEQHDRDQQTGDADGAEQAAGRVLGALGRPLTAGEGGRVEMLADVGLDGDQIHDEKCREGDRREGPEPPDFDAHPASNASSPTVNGSGSSRTRRQARTTPGMNELRSIESWRIESV